MIDLSEQALSVVEIHATAWGLPTSAERVAKRVCSTMDEISNFYDAMLPHMEEILDYLNQFSLDTIPDNVKPIAWTALAMCEVDNPVRWKSVTLSSGFDVLGMVPKSSFYDSSFVA
ncbi:MAG: hypothetical protein KDE63_00125 [Novosphingobium sp.]|nr:hypothetical protein [Novosphingobium sp.]